jgi:hypothetical protein
MARYPDVIYRIRVCSTNKLTCPTLHIPIDRLLTICLVQEPVEAETRIYLGQTIVLVVAFILFYQEVRSPGT